MSSYAIVNSGSYIEESDARFEVIHDVLLGRYRNPIPRRRTESPMSDCLKHSFVDDGTHTLHDALRNHGAAFIDRNLDDAVAFGHPR